MLENDLVVGTGDITIKVESKEAKDNFLKNLMEMSDKADLIEEKSFTCGSCAAYPCFRTVSSQLFIKYKEEGHRQSAEKEATGKAGLCYQEVRECRQECNDFIQIDGSGKSPEFQIKGTCKRDNIIVNYNARCRFLDK